MLTFYLVLSLQVVPLSSPSLAQQEQLVTMVPEPGMSMMVRFPIDPVTLKQLRNDQLDAFSLPIAGELLIFERDQAQRRAVTTWWCGFNKESGAEIVLTIADGHFFGHLSFLGQRYSLRPYSDRSWHTLSRTGDEIQSPLRVCGNHPRHDLRHLDQQIIHKESACSAETSHIDVLMLYTKGLRDRLQETLETRLQFLIDLTNRSYQNSEISAMAHIAHMEEVDYSDSIPIDEALHDIGGDFSNTNPTPDPMFAHLESMRTQYGADQVTLLRATRPSGNQFTCGIAWLISNLPDAAYSVVEEHPLCGDHSFPHELGHNMGGDHDKANGGQDGDAAFGYANGYQDPGGAFVTIMGYDFNGSCFGGCPRIDHFSNPNIMYEGRPTGVDGETDVARAFNRTKTNISNYRTRVMGTQLDHHYTVPELQLTAGASTNVGLINHSGATSGLEIRAYNAAGLELARSPITSIASNQKMSLDIAAEFLFQADEMSWLSIGSTRPLAVYVSLQRNNVRSAYWASNDLSNKLYVPHIAKDTDLFETVVSSVNGYHDALAARLSPEPFGQVFHLTDLDCPFAQTSGTASDYFGDDVALIDWAQIENAVAGVAAMEYFSYLPQRERVASLGLTGNTSDRLRLLHIATDVNQFWTGLVYMNVSDATINVNEITYAGDGSIVQERTMDMIRGTKQTILYATDSNQELGGAWMEIVADRSALVGYELFGSANHIQHRYFAGLQGNDHSGRTLLYPHTQSSAERWTGLVALNVGTSTADISFQAMNDEGDILETVGLTGVAPKVKVVRTVESLFSADTRARATWIKAVANGSQWSGFVLWGDVADTRHHLSGLVAEVSD